MRLSKALLVLVLIAAVAAGGWFFFLRAPSSSQAGGPGGAPGAGGPPGGFAMPVEAVAVRVADLAVEIDAVGSLRSYESVIVRPEVAGRIAAIPFREGQQIAKGDVLIRLDSSIPQAELNQERANLVLARTNFERADRLFRDRVGTERSRDEAVSALRVAESRVAAAETRLEKMTIVAPFPGIVGLRKVSVGDFVGVGQDIVNLEQIDPLKVDFRVAEIELGNIAVGQTVKVQVDAFPGRTFEGKVYAIDPSVDIGGRSIAIRAELANQDQALRPGLFARIKLVVTRAAGALLVPEEALIPMGNDRLVYKVVDGKVAPVPVKIGERVGGQAQILSGLAPGDTVITAGQIKVQPGMPVMVIPSGGPGAPPAAAPGGQAAGQAPG